MVQTESENVVSLFAAKQKNEDKKVSEEASQDINEEEISKVFEDTIEKNNQLRDRLKKARLKANKSVLRSYRLKN